MSLLIALLEEGGDHQLSPAHFVDADAHYQHALHGRLAPAQLTNTSSFYSAALNGRLDPARLTNSSSFYQPRIGETTLRPAAFTNASVFYTAALHGHLAPETLVNLSVFHAPTITFEPVQVTPTVIDGSGLRIIRKRRRVEKPAVRRLDTYRTPEDIRREQLETERYLASLEKPQQAPATERRGETGENGLGQAPETTTPAAAPILADVAARAALAVQAKLEEARQAAAATRIADDKRRRTLALLLALD